MNVILGQGIAGTLLAIRLIQKGERVVVIDNGHRNSSSAVAAGLWNPIVFRRINKSWMADEFCAELETFYPALEILLGAKFYYPITVCRLHSSLHESELWADKRNWEEFEKFLGETCTDFSVRYPYSEEAPHGASFVKHTGYLDLPVLLEAGRKYFNDKALYLEDSISLMNPSIELDQFEFDGIKPKRIIDCRGYSSAGEKCFSWLPFGLTKGEVLTIKCDQLRLNDVYSAGFFILPLGNNLYRVGATFNWSDKDQIPTEKGREDLLNKLRRWMKIDFEVVDHKAGVRPTVQDRRPLLGRHPNFDNLYIFNGLGTKGVLLAPWLSAHFCDFLMNGSELLSEVNISRFEHLIGTEHPQINYPIG